MSDYNTIDDIFLENLQENVSDDYLLDTENIGDIIDIVSESDDDALSTLFD